MKLALTLLLIALLPAHRVFAQESEVPDQPMPGFTEHQGDPLQYWKARAEKGSTRAQFRLGEMYAFGEGVAQDFKQAVEWYRRAAENGFAEAQLRLGRMYTVGAPGIEKNSAEALRWLTTAAQHNHAVAQNTLALAYHNGTLGKRDETQALQWFRAAAKQGYGHAEENLGIYLRDGRGEAQNWPRSVSVTGSAKRLQLTGSRRYKCRRTLTRPFIRRCLWAKKEFPALNMRSHLRTGTV
jgi:TPR repeat protein